MSLVREENLQSSTICGPVAAPDRRLGRVARHASRALLGVCLVACSGKSHGTSSNADASSDAASPDGGSSSLSATIYRTSYGIPHIVATSIPAMAFGQGYAVAEDHVCLLASQIVKVRSELSLYFGAGESNANLDSDFGYLALDLYKNAVTALAASPPEVQAAIEAFALGYNEYLAKTPSAALPSACASASWVAPISATDLMARYLDLGLATIAPIISFVGGATPPVQSARVPSPGLPASLGHQLGRAASNAWALGPALSSGKASVLANPHLPWTGELILHEVHLTVPGVVNAYGVAFPGVVGVNIGFNEHFGFTHTVSASNQDTFYALTVEAGNPTSYLYDGTYIPMTSRDFQVRVRQADGSVAPVVRTLYATVQGPLVSIPGAPTSATTAYAYRNANLTNFNVATEAYQTLTAASVAEFVTIDSKQRGIPWANTISADDQGNASYVDSSRVPNLSADAGAAFATALASDPLTQGFYSNGLVLLDGTSSLFAWQPSPDRPADIVVPLADAPQLERTDYVFNANDSYWLTNPASPLVGYPVLYGQQQPISPRSRMNLRMLMDAGAVGYAGNDGRYSVTELETAILSDRSMVEVLLPSLRQRCHDGVAARTGASAESLAVACSALDSWDGTLNLDSTGAVLWREALAQLSYADLTTAGNLYAVAFDPTNPAATPNTLAAAPDGGTDPILGALDVALAILGDAGVDAAAPLGAVQHVAWGDASIGLHGGEEFEGCTNVVVNSADNQETLVDPNTGLTASGYPVDYGSTFIMALEFDDAGPNAQAILTYGESDDPASPHFGDQMPLFAAKKWRTVLFSTEAVLADPNVTKETVTATIDASVADTLDASLGDSVDAGGD